MSILHELNDSAVWLAYLKHQKGARHLRANELAELEDFIARERYRVVTEHLAEDDFTLSLPRKALISKKGTDRKRAVYLFSEEEVMVLKVLNFLLFRYDHVLSDACYSFRRGRSVKDVTRRIRCIPDLEHKYTVKLDIHDYFNSIPPEQLLPMAEQVMADDTPLVDFFSRLFRRGQALWDGQVVHEPMGVLAGTATAGFFADLYLTDVDEFFVAQGIPYFRYSDDIFLFADTEAQQQAYLQLLVDRIHEKGLSVNPEKFALTRPGERWEYLGFSCVNGEYDLADITVTKAKTRIRRYARYLYREKRCRCGMGYEETVGLFLRRFYAIFFDEFGENEFAWNRWYFSVITTDARLKQIDAHMQEYIRYLYSGRHYKGNYQITYEKMKEMGYRSLVNEYYHYLNNTPSRQDV